MPAEPDAHALLAPDLAHVRAQLQQLALDVAGGPADRRRDLEHRLHQLGVDPRLELVARDRLQHGVDVLDEVERLAVEEHVLLLDAERVRIGLAERVVEDAAALDGALAGDRVADRSASRQHRVGLDLDPPARVEQALDDDRRRRGPDLEKTSPCARATSS